MTIIIRKNMHNKINCSKKFFIRREYMIAKKNLFLILIALVYLTFNMVVFYVEINRHLMFCITIIGLIPVLFLDASPLGWKSRTVSLLLALVIEALIILISAYIFESGNILTIYKIFFDAGSRLVPTYCTVGVLVIYNLIIYILHLRKLRS